VPAQEPAAAGRRTATGRYHRAVLPGRHLRSESHRARGLPSPAGLLDEA